MGATMPNNPGPRNRGITTVSKLGGMVGDPGIDLYTKWGKWFY